VWARANPKRSQRPIPTRPLPSASMPKSCRTRLCAVPRGWENLDSFRVCESLEAAASRSWNAARPSIISAACRRPPDDHDRRVDEAPKRIADLAADATALDARRLVCAAWWQDYKKSLASLIRADILRSLSAAGLVRRTSRAPAQLTARRAEPYVSPRRVHKTRSRCSTPPAQAEQGSARHDRRPRPS